MGVFAQLMVVGLVGVVLESAGTDLPCSNRTTAKQCNLASSSSSSSSSDCNWDFYIESCCNYNISKPSQQGGQVCPCTQPCCAHQWNDPNIRPEAVKAYKKAAGICQNGTTGDQYVDADNMREGLDLDCVCTHCVCTYCVCTWTAFVRTAFVFCSTHILLPYCIARCIDLAWLLMST